MDQIPPGFWRPVAESFIQAQIKKPFLGRAYLVFGECFSLWAYMMEMAGILAARHAAWPDELYSALMGMSGAPGAAAKILVQRGDEMLARHPLGTMTFSDYVAADIGRRTGVDWESLAADADRMLAQQLGRSLGPVARSDRKADDWANLVTVMGAQKTPPKDALTQSWEYASEGAALGATHPDVLRGMFERSHKPVSNKEWRTAYAAGLDIGPEPPPQASYAEAEASENKNFMEYCQQFCPDEYAVLNDQ
jgi:hypothetical protein